MKITTWSLANLKERKKNKKYIPSRTQKSDNVVIIYIYLFYLQITVRDTVEESYILGYNAVYSVESQPTFRVTFRPHLR
jgi:hypothetical protein